MTAIPLLLLLIAVRGHHFRSPQSCPHALAASQCHRCFHWSQFGSILRSHFGSLTALATTDQIRGLLERALNHSQSLVNSRFTDRRIREANDRLFGHVRRLVAVGGQRRVEEHVNGVFDAIFVSQLERKKKKQFSGNFLKCIQNLWKENHWFTDYPTILVQQMARGLDVTSLFLSAFSLIRRTVRQSETGLLRCVGQSVCVSKCHEPWIGCFGQWSAVDEWWRRLTVTSLPNLTSGDRNPEMAFGSVAEMLVASAEELDRKAEELGEKVLIGCGKPQRYLRETPSQTTANHSAPFTPFQPRLQTIVDQLSTNENFFLSLPNVFCGEMANTSTDQIWPPVATDDAKTLSEKLEKVNHVINTYVTPEELLMDASGSGHLDSFSDDEDYSQGSGSGDKEVDIAFSPPTSSVTLRCHSFIDSVIIFIFFLIKVQNF